MGGEMLDDKSLCAPMCACCSKTWCIVFTCYYTIIVRIEQYLVLYNKYEVGLPANTYQNYQLQITMLCSVCYHRIAGEYDGPPF